MRIDTLIESAVRAAIVVGDDPVPCDRIPPNGCPLYVYPQIPSN